MKAFTVSRTCSASYRTAGFVGYTARRVSCRGNVLNTRAGSHALLYPEKDGSEVRLHKFGCSCLERKYLVACNNTLAGALEGRHL